MNAFVILFIAGKYTAEKEALQKTHSAKAQHKPYKNRSEEKCFGVEADKKAEKCDAYQWKGMQEIASAENKGIFKAGPCSVVEAGIIGKNIVQHGNVDKAQGAENNLQRKGQSPAQLI